MNVNNNGPVSGSKKASPIKAQGEVTKVGKQLVKAADALVAPAHRPVIADSRAGTPVAGNVVPGKAREIFTGSLPLDDAKAKDAVAEAIRFITQSSGHKVQISGNNLRARLVEQDSLGLTHVRLERFYDDIRVLGEECVTHINTEGRAIRTTGDVTQAITETFDESCIAPQQAISTALASFVGQPETAPTIERVYRCDSEGKYRCAYHVVARDVGNQVALGKEPLEMNYLVDAKTGEVFEKWNAIPSYVHRLENRARARAAWAASGETSASPSVDADDTTLYSGKVHVEATKDTHGNWVLQSVVDGVTVITKDARNSSDSRGAVDVTDNNNNWGEPTDADRQRAAVDTHYAAVALVRYLKDVYGITSIDNKGIALQNFAHIGNRMVNAFYTSAKTHFGDGDDNRSGPLVSIDIVGHEWGHGIIDFSSKLEYSNESGGGNESFADVTGFGLEWYLARTNLAVKWDYGMGEDPWTPKNGNPDDALRYLDEPTADGRSIDHYINFNKNPEVHGCSGIGNKAAALAAKGGTNKTSGLSVEKGIGEPNMLKVWGRGYRTFLNPRSGFEQQWKACVQAAIDLFGANSPEVQIVNASWNACMRMQPPASINTF